MFSTFSFFIKTFFLRRPDVSQVVKRSPAGKKKKEKNPLPARDISPRIYEEGKGEGGKLLVYKCIEANIQR